MYQRQVSFGEAVRMALTTNYCNFSGRSSRSEYWWFFLFDLLISMAIGLIFGTDTTGQIINYVVSLAFLLPGLGLVVRRLHDIGRSGWWIFICFVPLVGAIVLIYWLCKDSQMHPNQYGPVPNVTA